MGVFVFVAASFDKWKTGNHRVNISLTPLLPLLRVVPTEEGGSYLVPTELG